MKFAITFGRLHHRTWIDAAEAADELGFESVWLPEHLVLPVTMAGSPYAESDHPPVPPNIPVYDAIGYLCNIAARTERVRLGTYVYLLAIRHPFVPARGFATLDILSNGRAVAGVGVGWLVAEWEAVGLDPLTRGQRLEEAIAVCRQLWTEPTVEYHGTHFDFQPVAFEPKPVQRPIPIYVGGESQLALRRAASLGDGWIGMGQTAESAAALVKQLRAAQRATWRPDRAIEVTVSGAVSSAQDLKAWEAAGVDRLIVSPWERSRDALDAMRRFSQRFIGRAAAE